MLGLSLIPIAVLAGLPALVYPSSGSAAIGAGAGILCAVGVAGRVPSLVTAGASIALIQYALALALAAPRARPAGAVVLGVALAVLLELSDFHRRFHGAAPTPRATRLQLRHCLAGASVGALAAAALGVVATAVRVGGSPVLYPLLAAAGALAAAAGVAGALGRRRGQSG
ncbi:MAG TPA: hypothetical protein VEL75_05155 [Candidatus Methylomirabilis sp.]|nr:hypothetical protein [Candidatus Methylomirabilis sp.]